ncbi:phosphoglycerate dehydrogenase [Peptacetobacter hiranonis]|uniref:4-phosphoerythronate dehydrogenase n=1 Tax=Peptacetobacter hiranonis (strain DSM 13275 / JCM 10541 / KCTC 15199 / TO-931) TaxID=500633 RepID=B6FY37_PEPHT|nr:phosphoglycerate dehydrogenase [Peptacetobacter hiranonis]EEA85584.1 4-phosphoerythronate dehydrogenase [Peptacetobacter hiranonis DSM 13275]QEK20088.1 Hydroxypyruvate reductase [Peptacetobacter hiranonis]
MKLLITKKFDDEKMKMIEDLGYDIVFMEDRKLQNTPEVNSVDVAYVYYYTSRLDYSQMKNLKFLQLASVGFDHIPKYVFVENNIYLSNNNGGYSVPIAEFAVMNVLNIYKNSKKFFKNQNESLWKVDMSLLELVGKRAGILGTGGIGMETAKRLKAFGVEVWGVNTSGRDVEYFDKCFKSEDMDIIFRECDIVIAVMPSTKETEGMINRDKFEMMKEGSVFMNLGRGNLVNLDDLEEYASKFRGIALDVFDKEPLSKERSLWNVENLIITPHNSWVSDRNNDRLFENVYRNLKAFIETGKPEKYVDIKRGY